MLHQPSRARLRLFRGDKQMLQRFAVLLSAAGMVVTIACSQSDPGVTTAVKSKLAADDTVKAYQIDVDTKDHVVTLSGTVETAAAKEQAVMIARQTEGVRDVVDQITVDADAAQMKPGARFAKKHAKRRTRPRSSAATPRRGPVRLRAAAVRC
jgi:BON domain